MRLHAGAKENLIRQVPLFAECSKAELAELALLADEIDLAPGKHLTEEGEAGREFVVIIDGTVDVVHAGEVVNSLGPGDFVGELSLLTGARRTATVVATSPVHALVLTYHDFSQLMEDSPAVHEKVMRAAEQRRADLAE
ncbi:MAG TPA: cyclic nucleotide-binding domain-containing protein [Nocardioidaceae bacterium]|nr:cyclic nucleotide-binding domain-containing protein [Nocardioidaceae bacterium]